MQGENILAARIRKIKTHGRTYFVGSTKDVGDEELIDMLQYARRFVGYTVYPRWAIVRTLLAEVVEVTNKNGYYRHKLKKAFKDLERELDMLEAYHIMDFDRDFIEVLGGSVMGKSLALVNEIRGAIGGMMLNGGVKNYVVYSYPYNLTNLCYDNTVVWDRVMDAVKRQFNVDFSDVFLPYRGNKAYNAAMKMMDEYVKMVGETIPRIKWQGTLAQRKLDSLERLTLSDKTVQEAIMESYGELPDDKKERMRHIAEAWENEGGSEAEDIASRLGEKYKVKRV